VGRVSRLLVAGVAVVYAVAAVLAAAVMPYRFWDSLAFGAWSRTIAEGGSLLSSTDTALFVQRPVFYVTQGLAWRVLEEEWIGRLLSLSFTALLAGAVWLLATRIAGREDVRALLPPLALGVVLASSVVATHAASGMTDVPVAALVALTGVALLVERPAAPSRLALVAVLAAASTLTKPSALLAFAGLAPALLLLRRRDALPGIAGLGAGIALALAYDAWQAARIDVALVDLVTAGNDEFWRARGAAARWDALARAEWLGSGLRLLVLFAVAHAIARVLGARAPVALACGAGVSIAWSVLGPLAADGSLGYPLDGSTLGLAAWLVLAIALVAGALLVHEDPIPVRVHAALLLWIAPTAIAWAWQRGDEVRHLAPAWAPLALLTASALVPVSLALARLRPSLALVPAAGLALLVLANLPAVDGLGRPGWRDLLELGPSGWRDRSEMENFAYGPFSYELELARENVGQTDRIVSSNGRLTYFFPGRVDVRYARSCSELAGARFFSFLTSGESLELAQREGQPTDPLGWIQCPEPRVELVGEQQGIYAAFVVGDPPARPPEPVDCRIMPTPGQLVDALFGTGLTYGDAKDLRAHAETVGFAGVHIERTGCSRFNVVVTGVPNDPAVQEEFRREVESVGLVVEFAEAIRYPEVPGDVEAVR
jgi:hypothetical protein